MDDQPKPIKPDASGDIVRSEPKPGPAPEVPQEEALTSALSKMSKQPDAFREVISMMGMSATITNPLHQKMNEGHITQVLQIAADHDLRQFQLHQGNQTSARDDKKSLRAYAFWGFVILLGLVVFVICMFKDKPEILTPILTGLGGAVAGGVGGWGLGRQHPAEK